jgi:hypothetical protein
MSARGTGRLASEVGDTHVEGVERQFGATM